MASRPAGFSESVTRRSTPAASADEVLCPRLWISPSTTWLKWEICSAFSDERLRTLRLTLLCDGNKEVTLRAKLRAASSRESARAAGPHRKRNPISERRNKRPRKGGGD